MTKKQTKKSSKKYDQFELLRFVAFPLELEEISRNLYEKACCGSRLLWGDLKSSDDFKSNTTLKKQFISSAHKGMRAAQELIIEAIQSNPQPTQHELFLYRGIADAIGWQILGMQLCHARRLYKGHSQPNIKECNLDSVIHVIKNFEKEKPDSIHLICDLTSFIQVGDILLLDPAQGITIAEVKEGETNKRILDFMHFFMESECERSLLFFAMKEGKKSVEQLGRMFRQATRMAHFSEVMTLGMSTDPDTNEKVVIPKDFVCIDSWDEELNETIENSLSKGWAINIIDNCLFVGCYSEDPMRQAGHMIFNGWFDNCGGNEQCPRGRMIDSISIPLALPVFSRFMPPEVMFDILFGRKQICMAISINGLIKECENVGLSVRLSTNKETNNLEQKGVKPFKYNKRAIFISDGENEIILMEGIFLRAMYHGEKPISVIKSFIANANIYLTRKAHAPG